MNFDKVKRISYLILILYFVSLIPVIVLSFYNFPSADDYSFAREAHAALDDGKGVVGALIAVFGRVSNLYKTWQGNFSGVFMMSFTPLISGCGAYFLGTVLTVSMLSFGVISFFNTLYGKVFGIDKKSMYGISGIVLFIVIQCMPLSARVEGLFWYNSSIYYTFSMGVMFFYFSGLLKLIYENTDNRKTVPLLVFSSFVGIYLGGTNFLTGIVSVIVSFGVIVLLIMPKKLSRFVNLPESQKANIIVPALMIIFFIVSVIAPGNRLRGESLGGLGAVKSVLVSYYYVLDMAIGQWSSWIVITLFIISFVAWICIFKVNNTEKAIKYPVIMTFILISLIASTITPSLFATGNIDGGRLQAGFWIVYVVMTEIIISIWANVFYHNMIIKNESFIMKMGTMLCLLFFLGSLLNIGVDKEVYVFTEAFYELTSGQASAYALENIERISVMESSEGEDIVVDRLNVRPNLLFYMDLSDDPQEWSNTAVAKYYGLNSIAAK
ncbi:MAG: DUF6056 family protein [Butyrivibrio sp.]|nr:DUF6056 family protein [Butyrivibrio sp.]